MAASSQRSCATTASTPARRPAATALPRGLWTNRRGIPMRALRIVAYVAAGLIGLIVIGLVLVVVFVDPNDYRDDIEKLVEEKTGRELTLSGDLKLSVFP